MKMHNLKRTVIAAVAVGMMAGPVLAGRNLVSNFDHRETMGIALPRGWTKHIRDKMFTSLVVKPQADGSLEFTVKGEPYAFYEQRNLKLVPGGKYRLSYEVMTSGMGGAPVKFFLRDSAWSWQGPQQGPNFPDDTKGAWMRQECVLTMCDHPAASEHTLSLSCVHARTVPEIRFAIRKLELEAVDAATDAASGPIGGGEVERLVARIVPVDPLLANVNANDAKMTFYWPGMPAGNGGRYRVVARIKDKNYGKRPVSAMLDDRGYATVCWGKVWPDRYDMGVRVEDADAKVLATNEYRMVVKRPAPMLTAGRRLNNFVTALVDRPLENGTVEFSRVTPGWVWISFGDDAGASATGYLDNRAVPVVRYRDGERHFETQRFVSAGAHRLRITGAKPGGRLRINAVKTIWGQRPALTDQSVFAYRWGHIYTLPFFNRFDIHTVLNTSSFRKRNREYADSEAAGFAYERGMRVFAEGGTNPDSPVYDDAEATWKLLTDGAWNAGFSIAVDENKVNQYPRRTVNYSEAVWKMIALRPEQSVNLFYADTSYGNYYDCPETQVSEISATVNSGNGTGLLCPELYAAVRATPADLEKYLNAYGKFVTSALEMVPASRGSVVLYGASYVQIGDWSNYVEPSTDIKAHYAAMYRAFATDPRFAECAGVGCGGQQCGGEELLRWVAKLVRYYALEGGTEDLASKAGFVWAPGFVKNADMNDGLTNWTVKGEIVAERFRGYGVRVQRRQAVPTGFGDGVATFTTRRAAANELSQEISGLVPGKCYGVLCCVAGRDAAAACKGTALGPKDAPIAFSVRLEGATEFPCLRTEQYNAERNVRVGLRTLRYVFRAEKPTARLVFTDRNDDGTAAVEGFRQSLNYISFMPYYLESSDEPAEIAAALGWKGPNRIRDRR